jgi:phosphohistidine phosphatase SixA
LGRSTLKPEPSEALLPEADPSLLRKALAARSGRHVLCVGHLPHLDETIAHLLGAPRAVTELKKAGVVCLELPASGPGTIRWAAPPKLLRRLGR